MDSLNRRLERLEAAFHQPAELLCFPDQGAYSEWLCGPIDELFNPNLGEHKVYIGVDLDRV